MALPKAPKGRTTSSFHHFTFVWQSWWAQQAMRINGSQLLFYLSSLLMYFTAMHHFMFFFFKDKKLYKTKTIPCWARKKTPFQCDLKPVGITFCPDEYESEDLTKHEEPVLSTHTLTHCWFRDARVFFLFIFRFERLTHQHGADVQKSFSISERW